MSKAAAATADGDIAPPKKKSKLILLIGIGVLVLALTGGGSFFMMSKKKAAEAEPDGEDGHAPAATAHARAKSGSPPTFVPMEPFTVNLMPENGEQYLQVVATLKVEDSHVADDLKTYMPELRHRVLMLLSGKKASDLQGVDGREALAEEIMSASNVVLGFGSTSKGKGSTALDSKVKKALVEGPVVSVLFTSFIIQ